jgi:sporulation protein YlmC with PRC-barrel domain
MTDMTLDQLEGRPVIGADGQKIGTVADVYFDKDTHQPDRARTQARPEPDPRRTP